MSEQISALIDDELAIEDAALIVTAMQTNKYATEAWSHYHLIGDAMRGSATFSPNFKQNLMQKLEQEPTVLAPNASQIKAGKVGEFKQKLPATWSIAASVAAIILVGWVAINEQTHSDNAVASIAATEVESADQSIPTEYLMAHQASAPSASSYYIQPVNFSE